jgi:hypothetical protein
LPLTLGSVDGHGGFWSSGAAIVGQLLNQSFMTGERLRPYGLDSGAFGSGTSNQAFRMASGVAR